MNFCCRVFRIRSVYSHAGRLIRMQNSPDSVHRVDLLYHLNLKMAGWYSATIESKAGNQLQLLSPWKTIYVDGLKTDIDPDGLVTINTSRGQILKFSENQTY